ncbi:MAG: hypothetical protein R3E08_11105 [Thiotrichaceae bacterium]
MWHDTEAATSEFQLLTYSEELSGFVDKLGSWLRGDDQKWLEELITVPQLPVM